MKEFTVEYSKPMQTIFNSITRTSLYPKQWIVEEQVPIPKQFPHENIDQLRPISKTHFFSKTYEGCLREWLLPIDKPFLDPSNYGGLKGSSPIFYLINLLHFIHSNVDRPDPHAVLLAQADLTKAFQKVSHYNVIIGLHSMRVPGWLLRILASYLLGEE